jgi:hypothetical protein
MYKKRIANQRNLKNPIDSLKSNDIKIIKDHTGKFIRVGIYINDNEYIQLATRAKFRDETRSKIYRYLKDELKSQLFVEMGIGVGEILTYIKKYNYKIIELNEQLFKLFENKCNIINDDIFDHVQHNLYSNTSFIIRHSFWFFKDLIELNNIIKKFSKQKNNNNYLIIEGKPINLDIENCFKKIHLNENIDLFFIKL